MFYDDLLSRVETPYVYTYQVHRLYPDEPDVSVRIQLSRWVKAGRLLRLKRGLYLFPNRPVDKLAVSRLLYQPSYISLETALNNFGITPDIPAMVTAITTTTPNLFATSIGQFSYSKVNRNLYFGFVQQTDPLSGLPYSVAEPEKAVLDWTYLRRIQDLDEFRVDLQDLDRTLLQQYASHFPSFVQRIFS
jgi:predicted transcriptional regulator of viral defense system